VAGGGDGGGGELDDALDGRPAFEEPAGEPNLSFAAALEDLKRHGKRRPVRI
jgi:hypothetical protein